MVSGTGHGDLIRRRSCGRAGIGAAFPCAGGRDGIHFPHGKPAGGAVSVPPAGKKSVCAPARLPAAGRHSGPGKPWNHSAHGGRAGHSCDAAGRLRRPLQPQDGTRQHGRGVPHPAGESGLGGGKGRLCRSPNSRGGNSAEPAGEGFAQC